MLWMKKFSIVDECAQVFCLQIQLEKYLSLFAQCIQRMLNKEICPLCKKQTSLDFRFENSVITDGSRRPRLSIVPQSESLEAFHRKAPLKKLSRHLILHCQNCRALHPSCLWPKCGKKNMWVVYRSEIRASHHIHAKNDNSCPATSYTNFRFQLKSYWHTMIFNCSRLESPDGRRGVCDQNSLINKSTSMKKLMSKRRFKTIKPNSDCFPWRLSKFKSCINGIYFSI